MASIEPPGHLEEIHPARAALPPRELGDLVNKAAELYWHNLGLFLGIGLIAQIPSLVGVAIRDLLSQIVLTVIGFVLVAIAEGAVVYAVAAKQLGAPVSVSACFARAKPEAVQLVLTAVLVVIVVALLALAAGLSVILVGIPLFLFLLWRLVMMVFYPQAIIIEHQKSLESFRRSGELVQGNWWRVFAIVVMFTLILVVIAILPVVVAIRASDVWGNLAVALASAAGMPWLMIGNTLLYFDLRVRKEGLTQESLSSEVDGSTKSP